METWLIFGARILFPFLTQEISIFFLYLGPDSIMPLASILAAVIGFFLLFWRIIINFMKKMFHRGGKASGVSKQDELLFDPDADQMSEPTIEDDRQ
jgi:hypothetical protein